MAFFKVMPSWHGAQLKHRDNFTFTLHSVGLEGLRKTRKPWSE